MRVIAVCLALATCVACGRTSTSTGPTATSVATPMGATVDPANVNRARAFLPEGFEIADLAGRSAPIALWGMGPQWSTDPPACGSLADPPLDPATLRGWSASGPGAIVYVAAAATPAGPDDAARRDCARFAVLAGHTSGTVTLTEGPLIDGAATLGLHADTATVVEGSTETHSQADTFTAYLPNHLAWVTVVTDPGSAQPQLPPDFGPTLLARTVSALRGTSPGGG